jgi:hypothetical protein
MTPAASSSQPPCVSIRSSSLVARRAVRPPRHTAGSYSEKGLPAGGLESAQAMGAGTKSDARESWLPASANLRSFKGSVSRPYPTNEDVPDRYKPIVRPRRFPRSRGCVLNEGDADPLTRGRWRCR